LHQQVSPAASWETHFPDSPNCGKIFKEQEKTFLLPGKMTAQQEKITQERGKVIQGAGKMVPGCEKMTDQQEKMTKQYEEIIKQHCAAIFPAYTGKKTWSRPRRLNTTRQTYS
jgi:hypothetical protein